MTTREDMIEAAARAQFEIDAKGTINSGKWPNVYQAAAYRRDAAAVLDAVLPQITTVEQLEALPVGSHLWGSDGELWRRLDSVCHPWETSRGGGYGNSTGDLAEINGRFLKFEGPLTVVWQPAQVEADL